MYSSIASPLAVGALHEKGTVTSVSVPHVGCAGMFGAVDDDAHEVEPE